MTLKQRAWLVMLAAYLAGIAVALNFNKVPPVMQTLIEQLHVDLATGGWLMSSFAVAGVILGLPAAVALRLLGPKGTGLVALACTILGSVLGGLASSPAMLLAGRVVEGIGLGLITVVAPAVISQWFPPAERGTPMGLWASWMPVGGFLMFNLAGPLLARFGWRGIWWFGALFGVVAFVLYAAVVTAPEGASAGDAGPAEQGGQPSRALLNPASWIVALIFAAFTFSTMAYGTWAPSYISQVFGLSAEAASFRASLMSLAVIPSTIIAGYVLDRIRNRYLVLIASTLALGLLLPWSFRLGSAAAVVPYMIVIGFASGFIPSALFTLAPETMPHAEHTGLALGILSVGQNVGMVLGPPAAAAFIESRGWGAGAVPLVAVMVVGLAASLWPYFSRPERRAALSKAP